MKLSIWVTKKCNMSCTYCYEDGMVREDIEINETDYIRKAIEFINVTCERINSHKLFIKFFGGEPLSRFDFIENFVDMANKFVRADIRIFYSITTNGTLMNDDIIKWFEENSVECALSIDGNEKIYSMNRHFKNGKSSWEFVDKLIPKLLDKNIKVTGRMTYNSSTADSLSDSCVYLLNRGFTILKAVPDYFDENWTIEKVKILENEIIKIYEGIESNPRMQINLDDDDLFIGRKGCAGGYSMFSIDRDGSIYPCTYVVENKEFLIGNIYDSCEVELKYTDGIGLVRNDCMGCKYYKCCKSASCLYGNYKMTNTMNKVNTFFCEYQKILYRVKGCSK